VPSALLGDLVPVSSPHQHNLFSEAGTSRPLRRFALLCLQRSIHVARCVLPCRNYNPGQLAMRFVPRVAVIPCKRGFPEVLQSL